MTKATWDNIELTDAGRDVKCPTTLSDKPYSLEPYRRVGYTTQGMVDEGLARVIETPREKAIKWLRENIIREQWGDNRQLPTAFGWTFSDVNYLHDGSGRSVLRVLNLTTKGDIDDIFFENVFEQPVFIDGGKYFLTTKNESVEIGENCIYNLNLNRFESQNNPGFYWSGSDFGIKFTVELVAMGPTPPKPDSPLYDRIVKALGDRKVPIASESHLVGQVVVDHQKTVLLDKVIEEFNIPTGGDVIKWLHNRTKVQKQPEPAFFELTNYLGFSGEFNEKEVLTQALSRLKEQAVIVGRIGKLNEICQQYNVGSWGDSVIDSVIDYIKLHEGVGVTPCIVDRTTPRNKYDREILPGVYVDVYDVLGAFPTESPAIDHAVKKLLAPGQRGVKDRITDLNEAISSIQREIDRIGEWSVSEDSE